MARVGVVVRGCMGQRADGDHAPYPIWRAPYTRAHLGRLPPPPVTSSAAAIHIPSHLRITCPQPGTLHCTQALAYLRRLPPPPAPSSAAAARRAACCWSCCSCCRRCGCKSMVSRNESEKREAGGRAGGSAGCCRRCGCSGRSGMKRAVRSRRKRGRQRRLLDRRALLL